MRILFLILLSFLLNYEMAYSAVSYSSERIIEVPPVGKRNIEKHKKRRKYKRKPNKVNSPRVGRVYLIIGIILAVAAIVVGTILFFVATPPIGVLLVFTLPFLISGIIGILLGLRYIGRNNSWDIDYK